MGGSAGKCQIKLGADDGLLITAPCFSPAYGGFGAGSLVAVLAGVWAMPTYVLMKPVLYPGTDPMLPPVLGWALFVVVTAMAAAVAVLQVFAETAIYVDREGIRRTMRWRAGGTLHGNSAAWATVTSVDARPGGGMSYTVVGYPGHPGVIGPGLDERSSRVLAERAQRLHQAALAEAGQPNK